MGNNQVIFSKAEITNYESVTYLTEDEIIKCYKNFFKMTRNNEKLSKSARNDILSREVFINLADFKGNPFRDRLFKVFTSESEGMTFDDYLNMMSVFSDNAPNSIKCRYAFQIYKFDETSQQDRLTKKDIKNLIIRLIGKDNEKKLNKDDIQMLLDKIFEEADIDRNGVITLDEFEHIVLRSSEFPMYLNFLF